MHSFYPVLAQVSTDPKKALVDAEITERATGYLKVLILLLILGAEGYLKAPLS